MSEEDGLRIRGVVDVRKERGEEGMGAELEVVVCGGGVQIKGIEENNAKGREIRGREIVDCI